MKNRTHFFLLLLLLHSAFCTPHLTAAPVGTSFTYQGRLTDNNGAPANGTLPMAFSLWDSSTAGNNVGVPTSLNRNVPVANGVFTTDLDFGAAAFSGAARWLEISVEGAVQATRTRVAPTPNAIFASTAGTAAAVNNAAIQASHLNTVGAPPVAGQVLSYDGASLVWQNPSAASGAWVVGGNNTVAENFLGTLNNLPLELKANNARALLLQPNATSPNFIGGWGGNSVQAGVSGATISGGGAALQFGLGASNLITDHFGVIGGGAHNLAGNTNAAFTDAYFATVGGGHFNAAKAVSATIGGGANNTVSANDSTIAGGYQNTVNGARSFIGGGTNNFIEVGADGSVIAGGYNNIAVGIGSTVGGGRLNQLLGTFDFRTIAGGVGNAILGDATWSTIAGGAANVILSRRSVIAGGSNNVIEVGAPGSFIAAGRNNRILNGAANSIVAGTDNTNGGANSIIAGGFENLIEATASLGTIGGGYSNIIHSGSRRSAIGGGALNVIGTGVDSATVPGGIANFAGGNYSFAAGFRAKALHEGSFVWGDSSQADIASSGPNQFLIRAAGGVGIGTSDLGGAALRVAGTVRADGFNGPLPASQLTGTVSAANLSSITPTAGQVLSYDGSSLVWQNPSAASGAWVIGGNNTVAGNFLGTLNNLPLELKANNARALLLQPNPTSPNVIGGWGGNSVSVGVSGATIGGGGAAVQFGLGASNLITDHFGVIGGGAHNLAGNTNAAFTDAYFATVAGGHFNAAKGVSATIGGGANNTVSANDSTIAGGYQNTVNGARSFIGGGQNNAAEGAGSTIAGGQANAILSEGLLSAIGGGAFNVIEASRALIAGGTNNVIESGADGSFIAAGRDNRVLVGARGSVVGGSANANAAIAGVVMGGTLNQIETNAIFSTIAGGAGNVVSTDAQYSVVGGGFFNMNASRRAVVAGGTNNVVESNAEGAFIAAGRDNRVLSGAFNAVVLGFLNTNGSANASIGGGGHNRIDAGAPVTAIGGGDRNLVQQGASAAVIAGGTDNTVGVGAAYSAIGGGTESTIAARLAVISGGNSNVIAANAEMATVGGGSNNRILTGAFKSTIGGGDGNTISNDVFDATIAGGTLNTIAGEAWFGSIGGGAFNFLTESGATIVGGTHNTNLAGGAAINGGFQNRIAPGAGSSVIAGGDANNIEDNSPFGTISGGYLNRVAGNYSTVAGGYNNWATADHSFACGNRATAGHVGAFVWADSNPFDFYSTADNRVRFRSIGGFEIVTGIDGFGDSLSGVRVEPGSGSWTSISDRHAKDNVRPVNARDVLEKVARLPLSTWNYKSQAPEIRHIGPMAQDFYKAFEVGETNTGISVVDADGVALAAIQGLHEIVREQQKLLDERAAENRQLQQEVTALQKQVALRTQTLDRWESRFLALETAIARMTHVAEPLSITSQQSGD